MRRSLVTVVETATFIRDAESLFSEQERSDLILFLAANREAGVVMADTAGVRKLRWAIKGRGKQGGARIIYYFRNESFPLLLLNVFAKNEKVNLTKAERNEIKKRLPDWIDAYTKRKKT